LVYAATICRADALAMGALVALAIRSDVGARASRRAVRPAFAMSIGLLLALMVFTHGMNRNNAPHPEWGYSLIGIASAAFVAVAARPDPPRALDNRVLRFSASTATASILAHPPIKHAVHHFLEPQLEAMSEARRSRRTDASSWAWPRWRSWFALISWVVLEKPLLGLKDRLAPR